MPTTNKNIIVIGDIHGSYLTLVALVDKIRAKYPTDEIVFVGDFVDRGPRSRQVMEFIIAGGYKACIANHEQMMFDHANNDDYLENLWINPRNGGDKTLESYKIGVDGIIDPIFYKHAAWIKDLPTLLTFSDVKNEDGRHLVVSHSSCRGMDSSNSGYRDYVMWNRDHISKAECLHDSIYNIFGHSPVPNPIITPYYANIDTGCCFNKRDYNQLTAIVWPSLEIIQQKNID